MPSTSYSQLFPFHWQGSRRVLHNFNIEIMSNIVPKVKLNNGREMPVFGLGTWKSKPGEVAQAVKDAIDIGYRHIDCARFYCNESEVGGAIKEKIAEGVVEREDLFITSKLWCTHNRPDLVEPGLKKSLSELGLEYLDLFLIHWPMALNEGPELLPSNPDGSPQFSDVDYVDTWKAMETVNRKGLAKSIGISNFNSEQIERLLKTAEILPVVNQIECHPYLAQLKLSEFCKKKDILVTAYSPLGSPDSPFLKPGEPKLLDDAKLKELGRKYNKTAAQIVLRYQIDRGHVVIPKSVSKARLAENFEIFDFKLAPEDVEYVNSFDRNGRTLLLDIARAHKHYPFKIPF